MFSLLIKNYFIRRKNPQLTLETNFLPSLLHNSWIICRPDTAAITVPENVVVH